MGKVPDPSRSMRVALSMKNHWALNGSREYLAVAWAWSCVVDEVMGQVLGMTPDGKVLVGKAGNHQQRVRDERVVDQSQYPEYQIYV